ncbi:MAG: hypothetical protein U9Q74_14940 [Gemmatimonadota bacterium]|nr:hypothetical protein [Gemmatimonadota bacterium]
MRRTRGTIAFGTPDTGFVAARREKYWNSEPDAQYVYNGRDYEDLVSRFPGDSLAAEASYALTFLDIAGECEGSVDCYLTRDGGPLEQFLRRYPASAHAADAVQRLTDVYVTVFEFAPQQGDIWDVDSARVSAQVFGVDSVITALPDALRAAGYTKLIRVMNAWHRPDRAREMTNWLASRRP